MSFLWLNAIFVHSVSLAHEVKEGWGEGNDQSLPVAFNPYRPWYYDDRYKHKSDLWICCLGISLESLPRFPIEAFGNDGFMIRGLSKK
jgi:hypothetical protein